MKKFFNLSLLTLLLIIFITSCKKEDGDIIVPQTGDGIITGMVTDFDGSPLSGVTVRSGSSFATTSATGEYKLEDVAAGNEILVSFSRQDFVKTFKTTKVVDYLTSVANASLYPIGKKTQVNPSSGGTVTSKGAEVKFPANAFVDKDGKAVTGNVDVELTYFNPVDDQFIGAFPGDFNGIREDGSETAIESFGFIRVDLYSGNEEVELGNNAVADIKVPVPSELQGKAPQTIPLWNFDEKKGRWVEEGAATFVNGFYVGKVKHFSSWNCDQPMQTSYLKGRVIDKDGNPLKWAAVQAEGVDYTGFSRAYSDTDGNFTIAVKSSSVASVWVIFSGFTTDKKNHSTPATGSTTDIGDITVAYNYTPQQGWYKLFLGASFDVSDVYIKDKNTAYVLANNLYKTTDGGQSWTMIFEGSQDQKRSVSNFVYINENIMFVSLNENIFKTVDGGQNWNKINVPQNFYYYGNFKFLDEQIGFINNYDGVYRTSDGGQNWNKLDGVKDSSSNIVIIESSKVVIGGYNSLSISTDKGLTWTSVTIEQGIWDIHFYDMNNGFYVSYNKMYKTTDGGYTWTYVRDIQYAKNLFFVDNLYGWYNDSYGKLYHTKDGGLTWNKQYEETGQTINTLYFLDREYGMAGGMNGLLLKTETGGE